MKIPNYDRKKQENQKNNFLMKIFGCLLQENQDAEKQIP